MDDIANELLPVLQALLPGFMATIVFYWLSDTPKPSQFVRIIQALICSGLIKLVVDGIEFLALSIGEWRSLGTWSDNVSTAWSIMLAVMIGLVLACFSHRDILYTFARSIGLTSKASVGEWHYAFSRYPDRPVVLNLQDGRRLMGFPLAWPAEPASGYFLIKAPHWVVGEQSQRCPGLSFVLIANAHVRWVEFLE